MHPPRGEGSARDSRGIRERPAFPAPWPSLPRSEQREATSQKLGSWIERTTARILLGRIFGKAEGGPRTRRGEGESREDRTEGARESQRRSRAEIQAGAPAISRRMPESLSRALH